MSIHYHFHLSLLLKNQVLTGYPFGVNFLPLVAFKIFLFLFGFLQNNYGFTMMYPGIEFVLFILEIHWTFINFGKLSTVFSSNIMFHFLSSPFQSPIQYVLTFFTLSFISLNLLSIFSISLTS